VNGWIPREQILGKEAMAKVQLVNKMMNFFLIIHRKLTKFFLGSKRIHSAK